MICSAALHIDTASHAPAAAVTLTAIALHTVLLFLAPKPIFGSCSGMAL